ncbi:MAG: oxidoreductase [Proteobacteria bacterium]|nr:oxidoreductase [Pseudomonadota bacterium]
MIKKGLLINYDYCTGCFTCEVACQQENSFPPQKSGIRVTEHIYEAEKKPVAIDYLPFPTELCNLCVSRTKKGELPACVKHCQSFCMKYGTVKDLAAELENVSKSVLFVP